MVALARAFQRHGHEVAFVTSSGFSEQVRGLGFPCFPAGLDDPERRRRLGRFDAEISQLPTERRRGFVFPKVFGEIEAPARLGDLRTAARRWQPDWLIHDPADFAAPLVAATSEVPSVQHSWGPAIPLELTRSAATAVAGLWEAAGREPDPYGGMYRGLYVDICPATFQVPGWAPPGPALEMRPVPGDARPGQELPGWVRTARAPLLYVTLGTYCNDPHVLAVVIAGLHDFTGSALVTIGPDGDARTLGPLPPHIHLARYVPQSLIMPATAAVICHGGSNSVLGALTHGLPVVCMPQGADQFDNASRCAETGLGIRIEPDQLRPEAISRAAEEIVSDGRYRERARAVQREIEMMPDPDVVVGQILSAG